MNIPGVKQFSYFLLTGLTLFTLVYLVNNDVFAKRVVQISPPCGLSQPGFEMTVDANGYEPNSVIKWKLVNSQGQIPFIGYFKSNDTGGFSDVTFIDDLIDGGYKMYLGTDNNRNDLPLEGFPKPSVDISIPCITQQSNSHNGQSNATIVVAKSDIGPVNITLLSQKLKIGKGDYNNLVGEVRNVGNDTANSVKIGMTSHDRNGNIIGTDSAYISVDSLKAGQKSSFDMLSPKDNFEGMYNYTLSLQWIDSEGNERYVDNAETK